MIQFRRKLFVAPQGGQQPSASQQMQAQRAQMSMQKSQIVQQGNQQTQQMIQQRQMMNLQKMQQKMAMDKAKLSMRQSEITTKRDRELDKTIARTKLAEHKKQEAQAKNVSLYKRPAKTVQPVPMNSKNSK